MSERQERIKGLEERRRRWRPLLWCLWTLSILLAVVDVVHHRHAILRIEEFPAFYGLYSFFACTALVLGARILRALTARREDHYGD